jgi:hypothetical protein
MAHLTKAALSSDFGPYSALMKLGDADLHSIQEAAQMWWDSAKGDMEQTGMLQDEVVKLVADHLQVLTPAAKAYLDWTFEGRMVHHDEIQAFLRAYVFTQATYGS